jgi:hypothetical protein
MYTDDHLTSAGGGEVGFDLGTHETQNPDGDSSFSVIKIKPIT